MAARRPSCIARRASLQIRAGGGGVSTATTTLRSAVTHAVTDRGSAFAACAAWPVRSVREAERATAALRREYASAPGIDHAMSAYRVPDGLTKAGKQRFKAAFDDDGEPRGGAAARAELNALRACGVAVVVTRVWGGENLGKVRAQLAGAGAPGVRRVWRWDGMGWVPQRGQCVLSADMHASPHGSGASSTSASVRVRCCRSLASYPTASWLAAATAMRTGVSLGPRVCSAEVGGRRCRGRRRILRRQERRRQSEQGRSERCVPLGGATQQHRKLRCGRRRGRRRGGDAECVCAMSADMCAPERGSDASASAWLRRRPQRSAARRPHARRSRGSSGVIRG